MSKISCSLIEDLMPLYNDGEVREETKEIIENHLKVCDKCSRFYSETPGNVFDSIEIGEPEVPKEKRFLKRARKAVITLAVVLVVVITTSTVLSYEAGKIKGVYGERFKLAEENDLFINVNQEHSVDGKSIVVEKILLDNSITSIMLKSSFDINDFDSVTLKDDNENYYGKVYTFFNSVPEKYQRSNGYTILNFDPVSDGAKSLKLEMIKWKPHPGKQAAFNIDISGTRRFTSTAEFKNPLNADIGGLNLSIDKIVAGLSQSEMYYTIDYENTGFDGVSLGWYHRDTIENRDKLVVVNSLTGDSVPVLSIEDITFEKELEKHGTDPDKIKRPYYLHHKVTLNPIMLKDNAGLKLHYKDLYAYYLLDNRKLELNFKDKKEVNINREYEVDDLSLIIKSATLKGNEIQVDYVVTDKSGKQLNGYMLDARIRKSSNKYAAPAEGKCAANSISFKADEEKQYAVTLSRLGLKLESEVLDIELVSGSEEIENKQEAK